MFSASYPVYYEDTDAAGVVYYANYFKFAERARTDWLRSLGISQQEMLAQGEGGFVVHKVEAQFHASAKLDDVVQVECRLREMGKVRMQMVQKLMRDQTLLVTMQVHLAMVGADMRPVRIPSALSEVLQTNGEM